MTEPQTGAWARFLGTLPPDLAALHADPPPDAVPVGGGRLLDADELLGLLRTQVATGGGPSGATAVARVLRPERAGSGMVAAAWRHSTYRQARAVLTLIDAGLGVEAQANARACLEFAVVLRRLALAADDDADGPLLEQMAFEQQRRQAGQLDHLDGLDAGGEHASLLAGARGQHDAARVPADKGRPGARTVLSHFLAVPDGVHLHSVYGRLCEASHAGLTSAVPFLLPALRDDTPVPAEPEPAPWAETALLLAWACWAADDAMLRFLDDGLDLAARHLPLFAALGLAPGG